MILLFTIISYSGTLDIYESISCKYNQEKNTYTDECTNGGKTILNITIDTNSNIFTWNDTEFSILNSELRDNCQVFTIKRDQDPINYLVAVCIDENQLLKYINFIQPKVYKISFNISTQDNSETDTAYYSGSGFGINNYYLITNYHVIKEMKAGIMIYKNSEMYTSATLKYADSALNLVILKTDRPINSCKIDPTNQSMSSEIYVYGYPQIQSMGISLKVTKGIISSKFGYMDNIEQYQIDAAVQPGNSGGPVIKNGKVVGITVSMLNNSQNVNYAIKSAYLFAMLTSVGINNIGNDKPEDCTYLIFGRDK